MWKLTGNVPGMAASKNETLLLTADPYEYGDAEKSFVLVEIWTLISRPITGSKIDCTIDDLAGKKRSKNM